MNRIVLLLLASTLVIYGSKADGDGQSQAGKNQRALDEFKRVDAEMTKVFDLRLTELEKSPALRAALISSQRAWLTFREADGHYQSVEGEGGSTRTYNVNKRLTYLTKQRIYQLKTPFAQGWIELAEPNAK